METQLMKNYELIMQKKENFLKRTGKYNICKYVVHT